VAPRGDPISILSSTRFADLTNRDFLQRHLAGHAARVGTPLNVRVRVEGFDAIYRMVETGVGIGIVPDAAAYQCRRGDLRHTASGSRKSKKCGDDGTDRSIDRSTREPLSDCLSALVAILNSQALRGGRAGLVRNDHASAYGVIGNDCIERLRMCEAMASRIA
jgi:hypothetical protein